MSFRFGAPSTAPSHPHLPSSSFCSTASCASTPFASRLAGHAAGSEMGSTESDSGMRLEWPLDESLDALAYSLAWHLSRVASTRNTDEDISLAQASLPGLVSSKPAFFEELLSFCRSVLHSLCDLLRDGAVSTRVSSAALHCDSDAAFHAEEVVSRIALGILVESCIDVATMLCGGFTQNWASAPLLSAARGGVNGAGIKRESAVVLDETSPTKDTRRATFAKSNGVPVEGTFSSTASSATSAVSLLERCMTPFTVVNLLACALLDSLVGVTITSVDGDSKRAPTEAQASEAFFVMAVVVGTDPEDLLSRFLAYLRVAPYPIRRVWSHELHLLSPTSPGAIYGKHASVIRKWTATTYATTSRKLMLQRSITGKQLESGGPASPRSNTEMSELWRYTT